MIVLTLLTAAILAALALLHIAWGLRIWWPIRDEAALARAVAGFRGIAEMPPVPACFAVAFALLAMAIMVLELGGVVSVGFGPAAPFLGAAMAAGLMMRGLAGFTPFWARLTPEYPFRSLDRTWYSPLCVALGLSLSFHVWLALTP